MSAQPRPDYGELMKRVEAVVDEIERSDELGSTIHALADSIICQFRDELGLVGGRLYRRAGEGYRLVGTFPEARPIPDGFELPLSYSPVAALLEEGTIYMEPGDARLDAGLEAQLGVEAFAAIEVGDREAFDYLLSFDVAGTGERSRTLHALGILRHAINHKVQQEHFQGAVREARAIQNSMLPRQVPVFGPYDIAGRTQPLEEVGGDLYDFIPITEKILGLAIADASGHGLPAALQVRDIYMGLRMGLSRDFKIVRTVERLNDIIHESTLTSRFVSMFYGELELNGTFIYVNAGHPPPYHVAADGRVWALEEGGAVLGPIAGGSYERGFVKMRPGDMVLLYTDGILESRGGPDGEEFGVRRLLEVARKHRGKAADEIVDAVCRRLEEFTGDRRHKDDRTLVVVRYPD